MLRRHKNKKGQNTAEYAILIALVVAAIVAMQTYAQRALQAKVRDASVYMANATTADIGNTPDGAAWKLGNRPQYEPYYSNSSYSVDRDSSDTTEMDVNQITRDIEDRTTRQKGGGQSTSYDANRFVFSANNI